MQHIEDHGDNHETLEKSIISGLRELFLSEILCDATIVTAGKRFLCHRFLMKNIDCGNCLWLYRFALSHNDQNLLAVSMHYISQQLTSLSEKDDFLYLELSELTRILSSDQLMVSSELIIYKLVCRWWEFQSYKSNPLPEELKKVVRFPLLSPDELTEVNIDLPTKNPTQTLEFHLRQGMFEDRIVYMDTSESENIYCDRMDYNLNSYDPITDSWEKFPFISSIDEPGLVALGKTLYVSGGSYGSNLVSNQLHAYDSVKNEWKELPSMANPRAGHGFLHHRNVLYALGGCAGNEILSSAECFNLVESCWTMASSLPVPLSRFALAELKGRLFLIGGFTSSANQSVDYQEFLIYDISSDTWSEFPLTVVFSPASAAVLDHRLYVFARYVYDHNYCEGYSTDDYNDYQEYLLNDEQKIAASRSFCMDHMGKICHSKIPPILEATGLSGVVAWKHRIYVLRKSGKFDDFYDQMFYWSPGDPNWTRHDQEIPISVDCFGAVTMQFPMKRFYSLIPGRR